MHAAAADPTETTANLIADVAPGQGQVVEGTAVGDQIVAETGATEVSVPIDPDQPVVLDGPGTAPAVAVNLPAEVAVAKAQVADDGTVVYHAAADGASAAVQVLADGSARLRTVTPDADGPHEFTYTFGEGIVPTMNADGTVSLLHQAGSATVMVGSIDKAWAVDADGKTVETTYQIKDAALVQNIVPSIRTAYPVVADPSITVGVKSSGTQAAGGGIWQYGSSFGRGKYCTSSYWHRTQWHSASAYIGGNYKWAQAGPGLTATAQAHTWDLSTCYAYWDKW